MIKLLKIKSYKQKGGLCGPASLKMVLEYHGVSKSEKELARISGAAPDRGVEAGGIVRGARKLGFRALVRDFSSLQDIKKFVVHKKIPVIVDWFSGDEGHYSVVVGINKRNIFLQDPEKGGPRVMNLKTFKRVWFDFPGSFLRSKNSLIVRRMIIIWR